MIAFLFPSEKFGDFAEFSAFEVEGKIKEDGDVATITGQFRPDHRGCSDVTYTVCEISLPGQTIPLRMWTEFVDKYQWASASVTVSVTDECFLENSWTVAL
jgi:hypothetical protein